MTQDNGSNLGERFEELITDHVGPPLISSGYRREGLTFVSDTSQLRREVIVFRRDVGDSIEFKLQMHVLFKGTEALNMGTPLESRPDRIDPQVRQVLPWWILSPTGLFAES